MPNRMYQQGDYAEKLVATELTLNGYLTMQARGSRGIADIVAIKPAAYGCHVLLVQVKRGGQPPHSEWNALYELAKAYACTPIWVDDYQPGNRWRRVGFRWREIRGWHIERKQDWPAREWSPDYDWN